MALAVAAPTAVPMRIALVATLMLVALVPRASLAQVRSVANEEPVPVEMAGSPVSAMAEWEEALAQRVTDAETWNAIGRRLYSAGQYRECIAAFEQSFVRRNRRSLDDARFIAEAYAKLGNLKQASRWRAAAQGADVPPRSHVATTV